MVRTIEVEAGNIKVQGDHIEVHGAIPPGRIISAKLTIDDGVGAAKEEGSGNAHASKLTSDEWEKNFEEMCALAPLNEFPADVSREAMYLSDEDLGLDKE